MRTPQPRGPLSDLVLHALRDGTDVDQDALCEEAQRAEVLGADLQLALWALYELHFRGFDDVAAEREWDAGLLQARSVLEDRFERELRERTADDVRRGLDADGPLAERIFALISADDSPSLAAYLHRRATRDQVVAFFRERSVYHLKESDPQALVLARLDGPAKVALAELLYDEFGGGRPERLHASLFAAALRGCGLDDTYGAYLDEVTGITLAVNNAMSMFSLHRRLRAASMGHLATFEATSSVPSRKIAAGVRRVGLPEGVAAYFDEHVEADAVHEQLAVRTICGALADEDPALTEDVFLGVATCLHLDALAATELLDAWDGDTAEPVLTQVAS